jgi:hypothetical protein
VTATSVSLAPRRRRRVEPGGFLQQIIGASAYSAWACSTDTAYPMLIFCTVVCVAGAVALQLFPKIGTGGELRSRLCRLGPSGIVPSISQTDFRCGATTS